MAASKYKVYFDLMMTQHKDLFDSFREIHDKFATDPDKWKAEFNAKGEEVQDIVRSYENRLCRQSEGSGYSKYSVNLSEKFQSEVRKNFPKIDFVGLT